MRMETVNGKLRPDTETDEETKQVSALVRTKQDAALEALLADLGPVFKKHRLTASDLNANGVDLIADCLLPAVREKLWGPATEEVLLGGRF
jgi:hypothetical protein